MALSLGCVGGELLALVASTQRQADAGSGLGALGFESFKMSTLVKSWHSTHGSVHSRLFDHFNQTSTVNL